VAVAGWDWWFGTVEGDVEFSVVETIDRVSGVWVRVGMERKRGAGGRQVSWCAYRDCPQ
jgi:hypothetical protein